MSLLAETAPAPKQHCLIFDPIPFAGGSKIATKAALFQCQQQNQYQQKNMIFTVLTTSPECWSDMITPNKQPISLRAFRCPQKLVTSSTGWRYWLKQLYFCFVILFTSLKIAKIHVVIGASGPGVDMALYLCQRILNYRLVQLIHGPVGPSRSIGYCLTHADTTFYLSSSRISMTRALTLYYQEKFSQQVANQLATFNLSAPHFYTFVNGINDHQWPTPCSHGEPAVFWAASLLKWKGLDTLLESAQLLSNKIVIRHHICFIRPKNIDIELSKAPIEIKGVNWYQEPRNLDEIRSKSNIFVSTSLNEPFGLSILEALAAGMCVVIPKDGSYWDKTLTHNVNCIKYKGNSAASLANALLNITLQPSIIPRLGRSASTLAESYRADTCYQHIAQCISEQAQASVNLPTTASVSL